MSIGDYCPATHRSQRTLCFPTSHQSHPQYGHYLLNCWRVCSQNYQHWHQSTTSHQRLSSDKAGLVRRQCSGLRSRSNRKRRGKTRSLRRQQQQPSVDKRQQTWRISWTSTSMAPRLLQCKSNLDLELLVLRVLQVPHNVLVPQRSTRLRHSNQTWTI